MAEDVFVIKDLIFSEVSEIFIPETKFSVIKSWEVKASSSAKLINSVVVIPEAEKALEKFNEVV